MYSDLIKIKKKYGEKMAHLCRELFPTILETEGLLYSLLESRFEPSKFLYDDIAEYNLINEFQNYICSLVDDQQLEGEIIIDKTPKELLDEAGYVLYECKTAEDIEMFEKYYAAGEKLCTFNAKKGRLNNHYVFFGVKKNVDDIKRENFKNPERQDEYGTSVISIQFTKGKNNTLSIKNRYNHTVVNPDNTFNNNLDNIVIGLTKSFEQEYNLNIVRYEVTDFEIYGYVRAKDGKFYKYNYEIDNVYYCPNNIIIDDLEVILDYQKNERYIVFDYFILDMKEKIVKLYDEEIGDSFVEGLENIEKLEVKKYDDKKYVCLEIKRKKVIIVLNKFNQIISYQNDYITSIGNDFLSYNDTIEEIYLENVTVIDNYFLNNDGALSFIYAPVVKKIGHNFLRNNKQLTSISMPLVEYIDDCFLFENMTLKEIYMPCLIVAGNFFLKKNRWLLNISFPNLRKTGRDFISFNQMINKVDFSNLEVVGSCFLEYNKCLITFSAPKLRIIEYNFLLKNQKLENLILPDLVCIDSAYLVYNTTLNNIIVPEKKIADFIKDKPFEKNFKVKQKKIGARKQN